MLHTSITTRVAKERSFYGNEISRRRQDNGEAPAKPPGSLPPRNPAQIFLGPSPALSPPSTSTRSTRALHPLTISHQAYHHVRNGDNNNASSATVSKRISIESDSLCSSLWCALFFVTRRLVRKLHFGFPSVPSSFQCSIRATITTDSTNDPNEYFAVHTKKVLHVARC